MSKWNVVRNLGNGCVAIGDDRLGGDPRHNYMRKIMALQRAGLISKASLLHVTCRHDPWCAIHRGGLCDCDVVIEIDGRAL